MANGALLSFFLREMPFLILLTRNILPIWAGPSDYEQAFLLWGPGRGSPTVWPAWGPSGSSLLRPLSPRFQGGPPCSGSSCVHQMVWHCGGCPGSLLCCMEEVLPCSGTSFLPISNEHDNPYLPCLVGDKPPVSCVSENQGDFT